MTSTATLTSKGQVTLPKAIRESLDLHQGDQIVFETGPQGAFIHKPAARKSKLEGLLRNRLPRNFKPPTVADMNRVIVQEASRSGLKK